MWTYSRVYMGARVGALTRDRQAHIYQGGARGSTDQSEASILYPPEYLGRMPHVRGVVWGHPSNICRFFFPVIAFSMLAATNVYAYTAMSMSRKCIDYPALLRHH